MKFSQFHIWIEYLENIFISTYNRKISNIIQNIHYVLCTYREEITPSQINSLFILCIDYCFSFSWWIDLACVWHLLAARVLSVSHVGRLWTTKVYFYCCQNINNISLLYETKQSYHMQEHLNNYSVKAIMLLS